MHIGVLGNEGSWYVERLIRAARERGHTASELRFPGQSPAILNGRTQLLVDGTDILPLDAIIVRTMPPGSLEQVVTRMNFLAVAQEQGVRVLNPPRAIECAVDKYLTTQRLAAAGLPVPDTIVCENSETAMEAFETLGQDIVVKPLFGAEGRGILRVSHPEMALRTFRTLERLDTVLYLQRFLDGPAEDLRILLLDGQLLGSMKRTAVGADFRANVAQSGKASVWQPTEQELSLARQAAEATGCLFCGVDLMYNAAGQPFVLEVNAVPGWRALQKVSSVDVPAAVMEFLEDDSPHESSGGQSADQQGR
ncbi:MAG: RimK family alpha-L-glutamate ligase [Planctomycetaceae bacterium]|nr:RimK family alpha-L-glutamate ligase [Planctomycetaceae bacterium]